MPFHVTFGRGFTLMGKQFGILGALAIAVGILGALKFVKMGAHPGTSCKKLLNYKEK